jgi:hypothetical protein
MHPEVLLDGACPIVEVLGRAVDPIDYGGLKPPN